MTISTNLLRRMRPLLGTYVEVGAQASQQSIDAVHSAMAAAFAVVEQVQSSLSFHDPRSELSRLNTQPDRWHALSPLAMRVLRLARGMTHASGGLFNCTIGGALVQRGRLPNHDGKEVLPVGVADDLELQSGRARLRRSVRITLDGIAKGFAVDCAIAALKRFGVSAAWVNAGGDLRVYGDCLLPVRHRDMTHTFGVRNAALASSAGNIDYDVALPGEILHPLDVQPVHGNWMVLAQHAWRADALTKIAALAAPDTRDVLLQRLGGHVVRASDFQARVAA